MFQQQQQQKTYSSRAHLDFPQMQAIILQLLLLAAVVVVHDAAVIQVNPGESIQAAIDEANPGDTVMVRPGTYQEIDNGRYGLRVTQNDLTLVGGGGVTLQHNQDQETGILAAPANCEYDDPAGSNCANNTELVNFKVSGFTVQGFPRNGIQTRWVDGFEANNCRSIDNLNNGLYWTLSRNGLAQNCFSTGSLDSAMWVAGSENVTVKYNELTNAPTGLEVTVSNGVWASENWIHNNTVGVGLYHPEAAGNPPLAEMKGWFIEDNIIENNNFPNPASDNGFIEGLPSGVGILVLGVNNHKVAKNTIHGNDFAGFIMMGWCTLASITNVIPDCVDENGDPTMDYPEDDPSADNNLITGNVFIRNGRNPSDDLGFPGSDIIYGITPSAGEKGAGNCFKRNWKRRFGLVYVPVLPFLSYFSLNADKRLPPRLFLPKRGCGIFQH